MSYVSEIQWDIASQTQILEKHLNRINGILDQLASLPATLAPLVKPVTATLKSVQKVGWDVHGISMDLTGSGLPSESPYTDSGDDLSNMKAWWSYVQETIAWELSDKVTADDASGLSAFWSENWTDENAPDAPMKYLTSVQSQAQRFSTVGADAGEFLVKLIQLGDFIDDYWTKYDDFEKTLVINVIGFVGSVIAFIGACISTAPSLGIGLLVASAAAAAVVTSLDGLETAYDKYNQWKSLHAPDPPKPHCGTWPRPPR